MPNGFRGAYGFGGAGFGFRGGSPPWPYVGWGRGGLLRCWHPELYTGAPYWFYGTTPRMVQEQELDFLKNQADAVKSHLEQIQSRIQELERINKS